VNAKNSVSDDTKNLLAIIFTLAQELLNRDNNE